VHPLGFSGKIIRQTPRTSQLHANILETTESATVRCFALALVCKLVAVSTSKNRAAVEDGYTARTASCGAEEPYSFPTIVASRVVQEDGIFLAFPILFVSPVPVAENKTVELGENPN
jgi:hypothetical protein